MLCLSAKSESALKALAGRYDAYFKTHPESVIGDVCFTANAGRAHFGHRLVVVGDTVDSLRTGLEDYVVRGTGTSVQQNEASLGESLKVAFLFTGQGSQWVGMGRELYETQASFRRDLEHCEEVLREYMDRPLLEVMFGNKEDEGNKLLDETAYTQPALFALEYSLAQLWRSWGIEPAVLMGHSVGEYVAACLAGVFTLEDGLKLVAERGRLMQSLPHEGEMVAVRGEEKHVSEIVAPYEQEVSLAAVNGPTSVVISGQREAIREIVEKLESADMEVRPLQVSHAFHSPLMEPMMKAFEEVASTVNYSSPRIAMVSNVTGKLAGEEVTRSQYWVNHIRQTVLFASGMETLHTSGYQNYIEVGPQPTLLGMGRQCVPEGSGEWLPSMRKGRSDWNQMLTTLGALYVRGASIDWVGFERDYRHYRLPLPTYPFQRKRYWLDGPEQGESKSQVIIDSKQPFPDEWLVKLDWEQSASHNLPTSKRSDERKRWLIFADDNGLGAELSKRLQDSGDSCCIVSIGEDYKRINEDAFRIKASDPEHYKRLFQEALKDSEHSFDGLVHLWSLNDGAGRSEPSTDVAMILTRGCHSIVYLIQAISNVQLGKTAQLTLVTRGCQAVVTTGVTDPLQAMLWGLGRTIALEQPELNCLQIDLSPDGMHEDETEALLAELCAEDRTETQVTYHEGGRYCARLSQFHGQSNYVNSTGENVNTAVVTEAKSGVKIRSEVSYLITGGLGGLGFKVAEWLIKKGARYLVLVGRKDVTKSIRLVLDEWQDAGVKILTIAADVSKNDEVRILLAQIQQQMPPLGGVFHAAGTLESAMIVDQDELKFDRVLAPKVLGAWNLHCLTKDISLDMFVMFSSVASLLGTRGQCNYAAANAFLDSLALYRHSLGLSGLAINWGPWSETGMASRATMKEQEQLQTLGWTYIDPNRGMEIFETIMQEPVASCVVAPLDWNAFVRQFQGSYIPSLFKNLLSEQQGLDESGRGKFEPDLHIKQRLFGVSSEDRKAMLESYLRQRLVTILGHLSDTALRFDQSLTELGLDSLMQTELRGLLNKDLEINVPLVEFIKASSIPDLAQALTNHLALEQMLKPASDINGDETEELSI
jgi:acyl transferase domain-containing protein/acyl carrier protein